MDQQTSESTKHNTALPPLPTKPDFTGVDAEQPKNAELWKIVAFAALCVGVAVFAFSIGITVLGVVFAVVAVAVIVLLWFVGSFFVKGMLAAFRPEEPSPAADAPEEERRVAVLGHLLADTSEASPMRTFSSTLEPEERDAIARNIAAECDRSWAWVQTVPAPVDVTTTSGDGTRLVGHVIEANPGSDRWVVLAHGYKGEWREMMMYAREYAEHGFNLLLCEMRAHGASEGEIIGMGWPDRRDIVAWASWIVAEKGEGARIVLHGHSMGAASVCMASGEDDLPSQVRAIVSDAAYSDAWNVFVPVVQDGMHQTVHPLLDVVRLNLMMHRGGYDVAKASPATAVVHAHAPILLIHGEHDTFVPPYMAEVLYCAATGTERVAPVKEKSDFNLVEMGKKVSEQAAKTDEELEAEEEAAKAGVRPPQSAFDEKSGVRLVMVPHAGHVQSSFADHDGYFSAVFSFVEPKLS